MNSMSAQRVALVTGGCSGIGLEICLELLQRQVQVVAASRRAADAAYGRTIGAQLPGALITAIDVGDSRSIQRCVDAAKEAFGPIDIVVNSAGISTYQPVADHCEAAWLDVIDTNLSGPFRVIRACLPSMKARRCQQPRCARQSRRY